MGRNKRKKVGSVQKYNPITKRYSKSTVYKKQNKTTPAHQNARPLPEYEDLQIPVPVLEPPNAVNTSRQQYYQSKRDQLSSWKAVHGGMQAAFFEAQMPHPHALCCICHKEVTVLATCKDCNPQLAFCKQCCTDVHQKDAKFLYHKPMVYTVSCYNLYHE